MNVITEILFIVSTGLLVPVIVLLLASLLGSLFAIGRLYRRFGEHLKGHRQLAACARTASTAPLPAEEDLPEANNRCLDALRELAEAKGDVRRNEKVLTDYAAEGRRELELPRIMARTGPMLGLMGTLIPMGPALVGLASGDIASMALNLQVAFSTTVVGLLVGGIGYLVATVGQRWLDEELDLLAYLADAAAAGEEARHAA